MANDKCYCGKALVFTGEYRTGFLVCPDHGEDCVWPCAMERLVEEIFSEAHGVVGNAKLNELVAAVRATCPVPAKDELIAALVEALRSGEKMGRIFGNWWKAIVRAAGWNDEAAARLRGEWIEQPMQKIQAALALLPKDKETDR